MPYFLIFLLQEAIEVQSEERPTGDTEVRVSRKARGFLEFKPEAENELISKLIHEIDPNSLEKEVPGLPAHLLFMAIRYVDYVNNERRMQNLLANAINAIRKRVKVGSLTISFHFILL